MPTVAPLDLDGHVLAAAFLGDVPVYGVADGTVVRLDHGIHRHELHDGLLAAAVSPDGDRLISGGEDGKVMTLSADGMLTEIRGPARKWVNAVAFGPRGTVAWSEGRAATVLTADGTHREFSEPRTIEGLAFAPKGLRIALARYNGVSLAFVAGNAAPLDLEWKGAHSAVTFSPDNRFLVTTMQENALHGWKLDGKHGDEARHMRMTGYPAKIRSFSWSKKGHWLVTSGAPSAIAWPFQGKDGPMGKAPMELGLRSDTMVTSVACHPREELVAIGYADGMVLAVRLADSKEALLRRPGKGAISMLAWNPAGRLLAFASEAGDCGVIDIAG
ncbi:WD40 repeat domain-containing protein [Pseudohoeflea coraliihabitans]|uniref:WD40 repeat domain-containing protein n=1 Tax=Pseudohoeflea coraliihabitans TaxID=2860393 RepID=A0ABS6WL45_9HYPH|nr:WD40 repeat domain-containing protein [Pseudohoeflea sp. DP4N28-3]MBW3096378.1 WD40 repeat domain-containing protein [Pseudohoeflea sp. DP4N28-3]